MEKLILVVKRLDSANRANVRNVVHPVFKKICLIPRLESE